MALGTVLILLHPLVFVAMGLWERWHPQRPWPSLPLWELRGAVYFLGAALISYSVGEVSHRVWPGGALLFPLSDLHLGVQVAVAWPVATFLGFLWHLARHRVLWIWRKMHVVHHSVARLDVVASVYFHPVEMASFAVISAVVGVCLFGLSEEGATAVSLLQTFCGLFQHWNVKTPRWVGYIIQRPESHCIHHQRGVHHFNYSDMPLWDILFGTFRNPEYFVGEVGLGPHGRGSRAREEVIRPVT